MSHPADAFASRSITRWLAFLAATLVAIAMPGAAAAADLNASPSNLSSVYSSAQAMRGRTVYEAYCTRCHGIDMVGGRQGGAGGPPLAGDNFWRRSAPVSAAA